MCCHIQDWYVTTKCTFWQEWLGNEMYHAFSTKANTSTGYSVSIRQSMKKSMKGKWNTVEKINYLKDTMLIPEGSSMPTVFNVAERLQVFFQNMITDFFHTGKQGSLPQFLLKISWIERFLLKYQLPINSLHLSYIHWLCHEGNLRCSHLAHDRVYYSKSNQYSILHSEGINSFFNDLLFQHGHSYI